MNTFSLLKAGLAFALGLSCALSASAAATTYKFKQAVPGLQVATCPLPWGGSLTEGQTYATPVYSQASVSSPATCDSVALSLSCSKGQLTYPAPVQNCSVSVAANVTMLLHFDANATDVKGATPTVTGLGYTPTSKFGGYAANFDGGSYVTYPASASTVDWVNADFTVEAWVYPTTGSTWNNGFGYPSLVGNMQASGGTNYWSFGPLNDGRVSFYYWNGGQNQVSTTAKVGFNAWNHIAMSKSNGSIKLFINGQLSATQAVNGTPLFSAGYGVTVGSYNGSRVSGGYVDDLRITRGVAVYSSNFTPPTQAF